MSVSTAGGSKKATELVRRALIACLSIALAAGLVPAHAAHAEEVDSLAVSDAPLRDDAAVRSNLVLLVKFAGSNEGDPGTSGAEAGFNGAYASAGGYRTQWEYLQARIDSVSGMRSFRSYLRTVSNGQYDAVSYFPQTNEADGTVEYIALDHEAAYYVGNDDAMIAEALQKFNAMRPSYDASELDADGDGYVDNLLLIPAVQQSGMFEYHEATSDWQPEIGAFSPKRIFSYNIIETRTESIGGYVMDSFPVGTAVHEYLHTLDARDYYRSGTGSPVGVWDVMASSGAYSWPLALTRQTAGWCTVPEVAPEGAYTLYSPAEAGSAGEQAADKTQAIKVKTPLSASEYFIVEYRQKTTDPINDYDAKIGGSGVIVYRVNERYAEKGNVGAPGDYVYVFREGETGLTDGVADGSGDIVHAQVSTEEHREGGNRTEIGSIDMGKGLVDGAICYSDGQNSGLHIKPIAQSDGSITIEIDHAVWTDAGYWQEVVDSSSGMAPFGIVASPSADAVANGSDLYVFVQESDWTTSRGRAWKYDGSAKTWSPCGSEISGLGNIKLAWFGGSLYLAGADGATRTVSLKRYDGATWVDVARTPATSEASSFSSLAATGDGLYVLADSGGGDTRVYRLEGASLVQQGGAVPIGAAANSLVFDLGGSPAVVAGDVGLARWETSVYRLSGGAWTKTATLGTSAASSISAASVGSAAYVHTFDSGNAAYLTALANDGSVLSTWRLADEVTASLSMSSHLASDGSHLYLAGADGAGKVLAYSASTDDPSRFTPLGGTVYRSGSAVSTVAANGKVYCVVADREGSAVAIREHDALVATDPPEPDNPGGGDNPGGDNPGGGSGPDNPGGGTGGDNPGGGSGPDNPGGGETPGGNPGTETPVQKTERELSGSTRIGTAIAVAREAYPAGPKGVIVAKSSNFPDALAASTLAGVKGYPILLSSTDSLDSELRTYLRGLGGTLKEAILIGDKNSLSKGVEAELKKMAPSVSRIGGSDRFDTAKKLREAAKKAGAAGETAVIARADAFPDALSISPYCAATGALLYIVQPGASLDGKTLRELSGYGHVVIVGDANSVSTRVESSLKSASVKVTRLAGGVNNAYSKSRYGTSAAIAEWLVTSAGFNAERISFATGQNFPDALAGGPLCGKYGFPILLVDAGDYSAIRAVPSGGKTSRLYWLGSTNTLSSGLRKAIKAGMGY